MRRQYRTWYRRPELQRRRRIRRQDEVVAAPCPETPKPHQTILLQLNGDDPPPQADPEYLEVLYLIRDLSQRVGAVRETQKMVNEALLDRDTKLAKALIEDCVRQIGVARRDT